MHYGRNRTLDRGKTRDTNLPKKRRNALKMLILTKKSKVFIKAKLTVSKSYLLGQVQMHFKGCPYINHKISCNLSCTLTIFLAFHNLFMILVHMEVHSKYHLLMVDSIQIRSRVVG